MGTWQIGGIMRHLMNALDLTVDEIHDLIVLAEKSFRIRHDFQKCVKEKNLQLVFMNRAQEPV